MNNDALLLRQETAMANNGTEASDEALSNQPSPRPAAAVAQAQLSSCCARDHITGAGEEEENVSRRSRPANISPKKGKTQSMASPVRRGSRAGARALVLPHRVRICLRESSTLPMPTHSINETMVPDGAAAVPPPQKHKRQLTTSETESRSPHRGPQTGCCRALYEISIADWAYVTGNRDYPWRSASTTSLNPHLSRTLQLPDHKLDHSERQCGPGTWAPDRRA